MEGKLGEHEETIREVDKENRKGIKDRNEGKKKIDNKEGC